VPPNPLLGLSYGPAFLRDFLNTLSGTIVLVGHSYGGAVITNAATGDPNVKALVYVDGFAPPGARPSASLSPAHPGSCVLPAANVTAQPYPAGTGEPCDRRHQHRPCPGSHPYRGGHRPPMKPRRA
jgi:pimeloyl-ACP methyl ester carboxylesterase